MNPEEETTQFENTPASCHTPPDGVTRPCPYENESKKIDKRLAGIERSINDIKTSIAVRERDIEDISEHSEYIAQMQQFQTEVRIKMGMVWAGLGITATAGIGGLVTALIFAYTGIQP